MRGGVALEAGDGVVLRGTRRRRIVDGEAGGAEGLGMEPQNACSAQLPEVSTVADVVDWQPPLNCAAIAAFS